MARFRCAETGEMIERDVKWRKFEEDGRHYVRVPRERPKSRSERRDEIASRLTDLSGEFEQIRDYIGGVDFTPSDLPRLIESARKWVDEVEEQAGEAENLKSELEDWRDNIPENLQGGDKYQELEDAISGLETAIGTLGEVDRPDRDNDGEEVSSQMDENVDRITDAVSELESVDFPGMF